VVDYIPNKLVNLIDLKFADVPSAWIGLESIIEDILDRFSIKRDFAIDFGVDHGYSTSIFSNYFAKVWGVDNFRGDAQNTTEEHKLFELAIKNLKNFKNISLFHADYQDFIKEMSYHPNLIHVDIIHDFNSTYECGLWSVYHSDITLFHDTESFPHTVKLAVDNIAKRTNKEFYNFPKYNGLGIVV